MASQGTIGTRLKREREKKNFGVEDVHLRLRIHPSVIQKLESDDLKDWPGGKIYARGFLRQYSDFLGMNTAEILSEFDSLGIVERPVELFVGLERESSGETGEAPRPRKPRVEKKRDAVSASPQPRVQKASQPDLVEGLPPVTTTAAFSPASSKLVAKWLVAAMVLVIVGLAVLQISRTVRNWAEQKPSLKLAVMAPIQQKGAAPAGVSKPVQKVVGNSRLAARTVQPAATTVSSKYLNSPSQGTYPKIRPQDRMMLEVNAITDVWMRIQSDGNVVFEAILHRGETERWLADKAFETKLGRPEGVRIAVNGYPLGQPGAGKIKSLRFTRDGVEEIRG